MGPRRERAMAETVARRCLKVAMTEYPIMMEVVESPPDVRYVGPVVTLLRLVAAYLGLCYEFLDARYENYGQLQDNGSWTGVMGLLQRGEVDLGGTLFSVTWRRWQAVDFSTALYLDQSNVIYARPEVTSDMTAFIKPYTSLVWLLLFIVSLLVFTATFFFLVGDTVLRSMTKSQQGSTPAGWVVAIDKSSVYTWWPLLAQNVPQMPPGGSPRVAVGVWLLTSFIVGAVYRSNLKAMLIIPKLELPFDSMEDLIESGLTAAVIEGTSMHLDVMKADSGTTLARLKQNLLVIPSDQQSMALVDTVSGRHALFAPGLALIGVLHLDFSRTGKCRIYMMSRGLQGPRGLSLGLPKYSKLTPRINTVLMRLTDSGILRKIILDALYNSTECLKPLASLARPALRSLELEDFHGVFTLYAAGIVLALLSFAVEMLVTDTATE